MVVQQSQSPLRKITRFGVFLFFWSVISSYVWAFDDGEPLDESLTNEQCYLKLDKAPRSNGASIFKIMCSDKDVGLLMPESLVRAREFTDRLICADPVEFSSKGPLSGFVIQPCRQRTNGLPQAVMRFRALGRDWVADTPPAVIPSVAVLANLPSLTVAQRKEVIAQLPTVWKGPVALLSGMQIYQVRTMLRDARAANQKGEYDLAESLHRELLAIQNKSMGSDSPAVGETLLDLALNVSNQGRYEEAEALFRRAEPLISIPSSAALRARLKNYRCLEAANKGDFEKALAYARDAVSTWRVMLEDQRQSDTEAFMETWNGQVRSRLTAELTYALHLEAAMLLRNDEGTAAYEKAGEALRLSATVREFPPEWRAEVMMTLGESAMSAGRMAAAQQYFQTAQEIRQSIFGATLPSIKTYVTLGRAFHAEGIDTSAVAAYRQAFTQMANNQGVKADFLTNEELIDFVAAALNLISRKEFTDTQRLQLLEEVFYAFQMVRPTVIDKTIVQSTSALSKSDPVLGTHLKAMMDLERQITSKRADLAEQNILSDQERDVDLETKLLADIKQLEATQKIFKQELTTKFPAFTALASPGPIALGKMQEKLKPKDALVTYLLGRKESFALLIKKTDLHIARIPSGERSLATSVQTLRKGLQPQAGGLGDFDVAEAYDLYNQVLEPFSKQLEDTNHLIVNATGALASLPFAVLVTEEPENNIQKLTSSTPWLSRKFAISYVSSVQAFVALRSRDRSSVAPRAFFGIGNPRLEGAPGISTGSLDKLAGDCRSELPAPAEMVRALATLPDTGKEIQAVGKMLSPKDPKPWRLGAEAIEEQIRRLPLDQYRILYFATHGLLPGELKCQTEPALVLTPPAMTPKDKSADGLLQASEISTLKLNAELVVLSACNTAGGSGKFGGEALSGLAEAFFYAGAKGLVVSHWQVPSEATALLMTTMFSRMGSESKVGPSRALSEAQQFISKQKGKEHPYFWAAFAVIGDGGDESLGLQRWDKNAFLQDSTFTTVNF